MDYYIPNFAYKLDFLNFFEKTRAYRRKDFCPPISSTFFRNIFIVLVYELDFLYKRTHVRLTFFQQKSSL